MRTACHVAVKFTMRSLGAASGALAIGVILSIGGCGATLLPSESGVDLSVINETNLFGALTYELTTPGRAEPARFSLAFASKGNQPWAAGFDRVTLWDLAEGDQIALVSVAFEQPTAGVPGPSGAPGPSFELPDTPGKVLVRGEDFDSGDTVVVTVYEDHIVVNVEHEGS